MAPLLDERSRRRWAASEARMIGHGGVSAVAEATGLARRTIYRGLEDLEDRASVGNDRVRRRGGGRKSRITEDPTLLSDLKSLLEPVTRGDPMSGFRSVICFCSSGCSSICVIGCPRERRSKCRKSQSLPARWNEDRSVWKIISVGSVRPRCAANLEDMKFTIEFVPRLPLS